MSNMEAKINKNRQQVQEKIDNTTKKRDGEREESFFLL